MENITLLVNGQNAFPEIIRCVENAKSSIEINMFIWRDDSIGNDMAKAVLAAADRGVKVFISVDRYGVVLEKCEESKKSFFHKKQTFTEAAKIRLLELLYPDNSRPGKVIDEYSEIYVLMMAHPNIEVHADDFKADHSKYYIIDNEILFLGGINIEDKENGADMSGRVYGDYMAKLCGSAYVDGFREKLRSGKNTLDDVFFGVNLKTPVRRFEMEQLYLNLISEAKTELHITMAYFSPLDKFLKEIVAAHERGVRVTVVIPKRANFQSDSNMRTAKKLLNATNGEIRVYLSPRMLHTKLIMNDAYISFGSTNITKKAFRQLNELNLFVKRPNSAFENTLAASIENDMQGAHRVSDARKITYNRMMAFTESFVV